MSIFLLLRPPIGQRQRHAADETGKSTFFNPISAVLRTNNCGQYINSRFRADHKPNVQPKKKHTMSPEDLGILLRQIWVYGKLYPLGICLIYKSVTLLLCSITGTRPKVLFPPESSGDLPDAPVNQRRKPKSALDEFRSDLPEYIRYDELPKSVCYRNIELFVIRNPEGGRDIPVAVINFRNLKGQDQGAEG
jgi:hypothetical protein